MTGKARVQFSGDNVFQQIPRSTQFWNSQSHSGGMVIKIAPVFSMETSFKPVFFKVVSKALKTNQVTR
ncbi:hypothetical protein OIU77_016938 [Salix suchowensis]|uniref:Uncharacterized protein n=1 Tax=Salix suchowensis TaxID=1278906 RepID=A0ABQ8ZM35_9ROSI|nr:hypothetical protein OIU77_016938 [Salix suchowensis]